MLGRVCFELCQCAVHWCPEDRDTTYGIIESGHSRRFLHGSKQLNVWCLKQESRLCTHLVSSVATNRLCHAFFCRSTTKSVQPARNAIPETGLHGCFAGVELSRRAETTAERSKKGVKKPNA